MRRIDLSINDQINETLFIVVLRKTRVNIREIRIVSLSMAWILEQN